MAITGENKCSRNEVIELREGHLHFGHVFSQIILPGESAHAWKMIDFLMRLKFAEQFDTDRTVYPFDIPVSEILLINYVVVEVPADLLDNFILSIYQIGRDWSQSSFEGFVFMLDGWKVDVVLIVLVLLEIE